MDDYKGADRLHGIDQPRVWSVLTPLSQELKAANLVKSIIFRAKVFRPGSHPSFTCSISEGRLMRVGI